MTLNKLKNHTMKINSNMANAAAAKDKMIQRAERLKHEQNKRASEKRGMPDFSDLDLA